GSLPCIANRLIIDDLEHRWLAIDEEIGRDDLAQVFIELHIFERVAEIFRRHRFAIRPSKARPEMEGENAAFLYVVGFEQIRLKLELLVIAHEPRIAVDGHEADIALAADQNARGAAILAGGFAFAGDIHAQRMLRE